MKNVCSIEHIEYHLPETVVTNDDLQLEFPGWDCGKIASKVGINQRNIASQQETSLDLAEKAANKVFRDYDKDSIDFLLLCTQSPDYFLPTSACILQHRLGLSTNIGALDFNLGCSGFIYGLSLAKGLIACNEAQRVLLVTAETYSKFINPHDQANRFIFGDGAAATIVEKSSEKGIMQFVFGTDGSGKDNLMVPGGGCRENIFSDGEIKRDKKEKGSPYFVMKGAEIFNFTIETVPHLVDKILAKNMMKVDEIDFFVFHQANQYILNYLRKKIGLPKEKFIIDLHDTGNTVSSTIPIILRKYSANRVIKKGDRVMLVGFGVGLSWGGCIITI